MLLKGFANKLCFLLLATGSVAEIIPLDVSVMGSINSPKYAQPYPPKQNITWQLNAPAGAGGVLLEFLVFNVEATQAAVTVYNENFKKSYTGSLSPFNVSYPYSTVYVEFVSNNAANNFTGFQAEYSIPVTSYDYITSDSGSLSNPGFPGYPRNLDTIWVFESSVCEYRCVSLIFQSVQLGLYDFITVYFSDSVLIEPFIHFSGNYNPGQYVSPGSALTLRFTTSQSSATGGFSLSYTISQVPPTTPHSNAKSLKMRCSGLIYVLLCLSLFKFFNLI